MAQFLSLELSTACLQLQSPGQSESASATVASSSVATTGATVSSRLAVTPAADSPRVAAQRPGIRGLWILGLGRSLRARGLHQQVETRRTLRWTTQAVRQDTQGQRVEHRRLRLLSRCAADRGCWCQIGTHRSQAPHACRESGQAILGTEYGSLYA